MPGGLTLGFAMHLVLFYQRLYHLLFNLKQRDAYCHAADEVVGNRLTRSHYANVTNRQLDA